MEGFKKRSLHPEELTEPTLGHAFPVVLAPDDETKNSFEELKSLINRHKEEINQLIGEKGAVLFRGFEVDMPEEFEHILIDLGIQLESNYIGNLTPRNRVGSHVFTSTEVDRHLIIYPHNEYAYLKEKPNKIAFFCKEAPLKYGETPIYDCASIYRSMPSELQELFASKKIEYKKHYPLKQFFFSRGIQNTWSDAFETTDKLKIEEICAKAGSTCVWASNGDLFVISTRPAIITHPVTGELCMHMHLSSEYTHFLEMKELKEREGFFEYILTYLKMWIYLKMKLNPVSVAFADGTKFSNAIEKELYNVYRKNRALFAWKKGDVLVLDNLKMAHGRMNVIPPRKILTAFGDMVDPFKSKVAT